MILIDCANAELEGLDGVDSAGDFSCQGFELSVEGALFASRQFVSQEGELRDFAAWECGEAGCIGQSAAHLDQLIHAPDAVGTAQGMMVADYGFERGRQGPIGHKMAAGLAVVASE